MLFFHMLYYNMVILVLFLSFKAIARNIIFKTKNDFKTKYRLQFINRGNHIFLISYKRFKIHFDYYFLKLKTLNIIILLMLLYYKAKKSKSHI